MGEREWEVGSGWLEDGKWYPLCPTQYQKFGDFSDGFTGFK